jgi:hypothetical protein
MRHFVPVVMFEQGNQGEEGHEGAYEDTNHDLSHPQEAVVGMPLPCISL